jgi:TatD DNase family protein
MLIDTHAHIYFENFKEDIDDVIKRAQDAGVKAIIVPSTNLKDAEEVIKLIDSYDMVYGAIGVHPHDTKDWDSSWLEKIEALTSHKKVVAIGEIGLDYFYDFSPKAKQIEAFKAQLDLALQLDMPVIIHNREADNDTMNIISDYVKSGLQMQFHCYSSSVEMAKQLVEMKQYVSFTGNITFKKAESLRAVVAAVPLKQMLIETDSPFMTPVPHRGQRNEPALVKLVADTVAAIHKVPESEVEEIVTNNAYRFFGLERTKKIVYTYKLGDALYINVTNRCNADCIFCSRKEDAIINGESLRMKKSEEPDASVYINEIGDPTKYSEIVFCGYGEPTIRWDIIKEVAAYVKSNGGSTRINTNGHANYIHKRDITPEMKGLIDCVSISLNSSDSKEYAGIMRVKESLYDEMKSFAVKAKEYVPKVVLSVVDYPGINIEASKRIAEEELGVEFRLRAYF